MRDKGKYKVVASSVLTAICLFVSPAESDPIISYNKGAVMYVLSDSGLVLRAAPDVKSSGICVLKYGTAVRITDDNPGRISFVAGNYRGYWVKAETGGKEGYLFDGFISRHVAPSSCHDCSFNVIVEKYTDTAFTANRAPVIRKDEYHQYVTKAYTNGCLLEKKEGLPGLPHFSLTLDMKRTRLPEAFLLFRLMGLELMKGQLLPGKNYIGERKMKGLTYKESVTVTLHNNEIQRILITESSKGEYGMGDGMEQESIEFTKTSDGTMVKYDASGS
jgi:hypothetical protein